MNRAARGVLTVFVAVFMQVSVGHAADAIVYPAQGQDKDRTEKDKFECYQWAKGESGYDPMNPPKVTSAPPPAEPARGGVVRGAAGGAAVGAIAGAIAGDAGKGAAIGAGTGAVVGGIRRRRHTKEQEYKQQQHAQQQATQSGALKGTYDRAYKACLSGRGYTVQ